MPTAVGQHRSGRSAGAAARTWAAGFGRWARGWRRSGGFRRRLTRATDCVGLLQRGQDGRTAAGFCRCGARAIRGSSRGKPHLRPFSLGVTSEFETQPYETITIKMPPSRRALQQPRNTATSRRSCPQAGFEAASASLVRCAVPADQGWLGCGSAPSGASPGLRPSPC